MLLIGNAKTVFVYSYTTSCLVSQKAAVLPCLTQSIEHSDPKIAINFKSGYLENVSVF